MSKGRAIDAAVNTAPHSPRIKAAGVKVVLRYFGSAAWKCATKAECAALKKAGIDVAAIYETTADMMLKGGATAGIAAAKTVRTAIENAGGPHTPFVWFACDTDTSNYAAVNTWLKGAAQVLGANKVGIYGSGAVVASALKSGYATKGWIAQSTGWRGYKNRPAGLALLQGFKAYGDLGFDYDANDMLMDDIGQWGYVAAPVPVPVPVPVPGPGTQPVLMLTAVSNFHLRHHQWPWASWSFNVRPNEQVAWKKTTKNIFGTWYLVEDSDKHQGWVLAKPSVIK
jgi:hypothetical protein